MFLNFPLNVKLIPYSGVDLSPFRSKLAEEGILHPKHDPDAGIQACKERDLIVTEFKKLQELHAKQVKKSRDTWREHVIKIEKLDDVVDDQSEKILGLELQLIKKDEKIKKLKQERVHAE